MNYWSSIESQDTRIWDVETGKPLGAPLRHEGAVQSAAFSPDGSRIVTTSGSDLEERGEARIWDAQTGKLLGEPLSHKGVVKGAAFSPDGRRIVTASTDKTARLWDAETGKPLSEPLRHDGRVFSAVFSPDGRRIVTASADTTARVWEVFPSGQALMEQAKTITPVCLRQKQREQFYLSPEPPDWCITGSGNGLDTETDPAKWQPKWPYHTQAWKEWLIAKRLGKNLELPKE